MKISSKICPACGDEHPLTIPRQGFYLCRVCRSTANIRVALKIARKKHRKILQRLLSFC